MFETKKKILNTALIIMGILGYAVLLLPWYELSSSSHLSGYGSSFLSGGLQTGLFAIGTTVFGYGLYALPGVLLALGFNVGQNRYPSRVKALFFEFIGIGEIICMFVSHLQIQGFDTSISGYGYSAHAGFDPYFGYTVALIVYLATGVIGFIMFAIMPKPQDEDAVESATKSKPKTSYFNKPAATEESVFTPTTPKAMPDGSWRCVCGKINASYISTCNCFRSRRDVMKMTPEDIENLKAEATKSAADAHTPRTMPDGSWRCVCGRKNASYVSTCTCFKSRREVLEMLKKADEDTVS